MANNKNKDYPFCDIYIEYLRLLKLNEKMRFSDFFEYMDKSRSIIHRQLKELEKSKFIEIKEKKYVLTNTLYLYARARKLGLDREYRESLKNVEIFGGDR